MRSYYPVLYRFALEMVADTGLAEDIAGEAFIQLWKNHSDFTSVGAVRKFLWVTARRDCLDAIRNRSSRAQHLDNISKNTPAADTESALNNMIRAEVLADIYAAVRELPDRMQQVFVLGYIEGLKNDEIAGKLGLSPQTVRNQKSRALEILRLRFRDNDAILFILAWLCAG